MGLHRRQLLLYLNSAGKLEAVQSDTGIRSVDPDQTEPLFIVTLKKANPNDKCV